MSDSDPLVRTLRTISTKAVTADLAELHALGMDVSAIAFLLPTLERHHALTFSERSTLDDLVIRTQGMISDARMARMTGTAALLDGMMPGHDLMPVSGPRQALELVREMLYPYEMSFSDLVLKIGSDDAVLLPRRVMELVTVPPKGDALKAGDHLFRMDEVIAVRNPNSTDTRLLMMMADMRLVVIGTA